MLWYKAWLETRARFLLALLGVTAVCSYSVYHGDREALPYTGAVYFNLVLHSGHTLLATMWVVAVNLLMMGGLLREKAVGSAGFTLALPVSRTRLMGVRIAAGLAQSLALVFIPWAAMFLVASTVGKTHSLSQAAFHAVLLAAGGLLFFALALLTSSLVEGEYTAPIVSFGVMMLLAVGLNGYHEYDPWEFITGSAYWDRHAGHLMGPVPWTLVCGYLALAGIMTWTSIAVMRKREF